MMVHRKLVWIKEAPRVYSARITLYRHRVPVPALLRVWGGMDGWSFGIDVGYGEIPAWQGAHTFGMIKRNARAWLNQWNTGPGAHAYLMSMMED